MTHAIQAVAGIVIAGGAPTGIYSRKTKKKVSKELGIDENKQVESGEITVDEENNVKSLPRTVGSGEEYR